MMAWSPYKEEKLYNFGSLSLLRNTEKNHHQFVLGRVKKNQNISSFPVFSVSSQWLEVCRLWHFSSANDLIGLCCSIIFVLQETLMRVCLIALLHVCFFSVSVSGQNSTCRPSSCGDMLNISDPFRLKTDPSGCGDRPYELACENNRTVLNLYSGKYYVEEINYQNYSIRVVDPGLKKGDCLSTPLYHLTSENFSYGDPYEWPYYWKLQNDYIDELLKTDQ